MKPIQETFEVKYRYTVHFTEDVFSPGNATLLHVIASNATTLPAKVLFIVDKGLHYQPSSRGILDGIQSYCDTHSGVLNLVAPPMLVANGEAVKNSPLFVQMVHEAISEYSICRHSYVVVVGGGAVLDMAGYAAATAHRGVRLIRLPSTVLSQNDSGVGVKNGINAFGKKNFVGAFAPAIAVINDFRFLETLGERDWRSGIAEAVKVALIKDAKFFAALERDAPALCQRKMAAMQQVIHRCAELHVQHIARGGDPFEYGSARPLDFGHWSAHKLEQLTQFRLRHGEAVAIGIALDATYSHLQGMISEEEHQRILQLLEGLGFDLYVPELEDPELLSGLAEFREHLGGELCITLLTAIGDSTQVNQMNEAVVRSAIEELRCRALTAVSGSPVPRMMAGSIMEVSRRKSL